MIKLSIIIVSYNTRDLTLSCLDSIGKSGFKGTIEIVVVDNGSKDGSQNAIKGFEFSDNDVQLRLIENDSNLGFAKANNQGIKKSKGENILLLNSDTKVLPDSLRKLVGFVSKNDKIGIVGPRLLNPDKSVQDSVYRLPTVTRAVKQYWLGKMGLLEKHHPKSKKPVQVEAVVGAAFLIPRRVVEKIGLLDERYFMYYEDLDYCRRVMKAGLMVYYLPSAEVIHYHGASGKKIKEDENQWKRLIPSSKTYHGFVDHYLIFSIIWVSQKVQNILGKD